MSKKQSITLLRVENHRNVQVNEAFDNTTAFYFDSLYSRKSGHKVNLLRIGNRDNRDLIQRQNKK